MSLGLVCPSFPSLPPPPPENKEKKSVLDKTNDLIINEISKNEAV